MEEDFGRRSLEIESYISRIKLNNAEKFFKLQRGKKMEALFSTRNANFTDSKRQLAVIYSNSVLRRHMFMAK